MKAVLSDYIRAGYGGLSMVTPEYVRCKGTVLSVAKETNSRLFDWDARGAIINGHSPDAESSGAKEASEINDLDDVLVYIAEYIRNELVDGEPENHTIWMLSDVHMFFENVEPYTVALIREVVQLCKSARHHLILLGAGYKLSPEVDKLFTQIDFDLPTKEELADLLHEVSKGCNISVEDEEEINRICIAASGMTSVEAEDAFALSFATTKKRESTGRFDHELICREKARAVERSGCLKYFDGRVDISEIGGLENAVEYISMRKNSFSKEAQAFGCPTPKGIVCVGSPGTGKSLLAKATASVLDRPLVLLDAGALFGGLVGQSEGNTRDMIKTVEAIAPCVLMID